MQRAGAVRRAIFLLLMGLKYRKSKSRVRLTSNSRNDRYEHACLLAGGKANKYNRIGVTFYNQTDCSGSLGTVDDLTQSPGETWLPMGGGVAYSFELLHRGLQGQEQLDISNHSSNGDRCNDFIDRYFAGASTSCNNWGNIGCVRFWDNPGL